MGADPWQALTTELDHWHDAGRVATLWWRDDDAISATPALTRLLAVAGDSGAPLCLAVVPAHCDAALVAALDGSGANVTVAVHGWAHLNHAGPEEKKSEFPPSREPGTMSAEAVQGLTTLRQAFGARTRAVFVPPWNRMSDALLPNLAAAGYRGLSRYKARAAAEPAPGVLEVNTHADIVAWKDGGKFAGEAAVLALIAAHLKDRRTGLADADEPTGLLTHHLIQQDKAFEFIADVLRKTSSHAAARWLDAGEIFRLK